MIDEYACCGAANPRQPGHLLAECPREGGSGMIRVVICPKHRRPWPDTGFVVFCGSVSSSAGQARLLAAARPWRVDGRYIVHVPRADTSISRAEHDVEHRRLMDQADLVVVVHQPDGTLGESVRAELDYLMAMGHRVHHHWPEQGRTSMPPAPDVRVDDWRNAEDASMVPLFPATGGAR